MVFSMTSTFSLTGDDKQTLNTLTNKESTGSSDLNTLSSVNNPIANDPNPNSANQLVFMNQPLSWWVASLNSGAVKYTPISNQVNWSYIDSNKNIIHISIAISNLLFPNKTKSVQKDPGSMTSTITFEPKFGLERVDTHGM